ncbi:MAG: hypothetical protein ACOVLE_17890 [Pirellula staleyi]
MSVTRLVMESAKFFDFAKPFDENCSSSYFFLAVFFAAFVAAFFGAALTAALFLAAFFAVGLAAASLAFAPFLEALPPKIPSQPLEYFSLVPTRVIVTKITFEQKLKLQSDI